MQPLRSREPRAPGRFLNRSAPSIHAVRNHSGALRPLLHPDDAARYERELPAILSGREFEWDFRLRHADGTWRHLEASLSDLRSDTVVGAVVLHCRDTTQRVERERALEQLGVQDRITERGAQLAVVGQGQMTWRRAPLAPY